MLPMSRKTLAAILALTYALTIPILLVVHIHPLGIGSGVQAFSVANADPRLPASNATESASCQLCSRLTSIGLPQLDSSLVSLQQFPQSFQPSETTTISLLIFCSVDLRAPPVGPVA
jgi:hypothetical protein